MKVLSIAACLAIGLSVVTAHPILGSSIFVKRDVCPVDVDSCSPESIDVNTCCLPKNGFVKLSQQWHTKVGPADAFTIHGLWPDTCEGRMIGDCDPSRAHSDVETRLADYSDAPKDFMDNMYTFWPTSMGAIDPETKRASPNYFWSHEWSKHGTCVSTLEPHCLSDYVKNKDVYSYFSKTLELRAHYDLHAALAAKGIMPGSTPNVAHMHAAFTEAFGVDAQINCRSGILTEIYLSFKVKNVDEYVLIAPKTPGTCKGHILYPAKALEASAPTDEGGNEGDDAEGGDIPSGRQMGSCQVDEATVCYESGASGHFSKCSKGKWQQVQCKSRRVCVSDTVTNTHCA